MADAFQKVMPGQRVSIPAEAWNAMLDAAKAFRGGAPDVGTGSGASLPGVEHALMLRNDSGKDVAQYGVLGIGAPLTEYATGAAASEFLRNPRKMVGEDPLTTDHEKRFAIALSACPSGKMIACGIAGVYPCKVDVQLESHEYATVADNDVTQLESADTGQAFILWKEAGTGTKWALVWLRPAGGGGAGLSLAQATEDGSAGKVKAKVIQFLSDLSASPNFEQTGAEFEAKYFRL